MTKHFGIERHCHYCGASLAEHRLGVRLTPIKARVFDLIMHAGREGIDADTINILAFDGRATRTTIKAHVNQINDLLAGTDYRIKGVRGGDQRRDHPRRSEAWPYRLFNIRRKEAAA
jgi:hypothetical protein